MIFPSVRESVRSIIHDDKEYREFVSKIRKNLATYFYQEKLASLFVKIVDECKYITFAAEKDRRILNKTRPVYKVRIMFDLVPSDVSTEAMMGRSMADVKTKIIHSGLISPYVDAMLNAIKTGNKDLIREDFPSGEDMEEFQDILSTLFAINTTDKAESPAFVMPFI